MGEPRGWTDVDRAELRHLIEALDALERHAKEVKRAYYQGMVGVTYRDLTLAAKRLLTARAMYERASGRPVRSDPTSPRQVVTLLRSL